MYIEFHAPLRMVFYRNPRSSGEPPSLEQLFRHQSRGLLPHLPLTDSAPGPAAAAWAGLAEAALRQQRAPEALAYARHSLGLQRNARAAQVEVEALLKAGPLDDARSCLRAARKEFPGDPGLRRAAARLHQQETNWLAMVEAAEPLLKLQPEDAEGRYLLGLGLFQLARWPEAQAALAPLRPALASHPELADLPFLVGSVSWRLGDPAAALEPLKLQLDRAPEHLEARAQLADALQRLGRGAEAQAQWQRFGQLRSRQAQGRLNHGRKLWQQSQRTAARGQFEAAWELDPWDDDISFELARVRGRMGDTPEAIALLEHYLAFNRDRPWAVGYLSQLLARQGQRERARVLANRYHALTGQPWRDLD